MTGPDQGAGDADPDAALDDKLASSPADLARYIGDMTDDLSRLARGAGLDLLAHLLDVARLEAVQRSGRGRPPRS